MTSEAIAGRWPLPHSWTWAKASDIASVVGGGTPDTAKGDNFCDDGLPWITPADLSGYDGEFIARGRRSLSRQGIQDSSARILPAGAVLYSSRAPIGYCVIAANPIATNQGFKSLVLHDEISPRYIRYYLLSSKDYANRIASGTTFRELSGARMAEFPIPLAPPTEQERIVAAIDALFTRLDAADGGLKRAGALLGEYRESTLYAAVTGELTRVWRETIGAEENAERLKQNILAARRDAWETSEQNRLRQRSIERKNDKWRTLYPVPVGIQSEQLTEIPNGWRWVSLDELSWASSYGTSAKCSYDSDGIAVLRIPNIRNGQIILDDLKFSGKGIEVESVDLVAPGDLLVIRTNGSESLIGRGAVVDSAPDRPCYFASYLIRFRLVFPEWIGRWVNLVWQSPYIRQHILSIAATSAGQYNVSQTNLARMPIPLPPKSEALEVLHRAEAALAQIDTLASEITSRMTQSIGIRQSILAAAFRGELVSQDPTDEPAEKLLERIRSHRAAGSPPPKRVPRKPRKAAA